MKCERSGTREFTLEKSLGRKTLRFFRVKWSSVVALEGLCFRAGRWWTKCARDCRESSISHKNHQKLTGSDHFLKMRSTSHSCQFIRFSSFISIHCQFLHLKSFIHLVQLIRFNSFISSQSCQVTHFNSLMSIHAFQFIHVNSCVSSHAFQFLHVNYFMSIHSFQFIHVNSFMSIHSSQFIHLNSFISCIQFNSSFQLLHFNSFMTIHSFQFIHVNSFMSIHSCQFIHFMHFISCQFTSFQLTMNSKLPPCLFFETSAPARAGHYLVSPEKSPKFCGISCPCRAVVQLSPSLRSCGRSPGRSCARQNLGALPDLTC